MDRQLLIGTETSVLLARWGSIMKRIVLCLDGTWNNNRAGAVLTNVCKLHQIIAPTDANGVRQISNYVQGIVSADGESMQFLKGGIGVGLDDRIRIAYEALAKDYEAGDEIFLVGFSRGAFEARSLGGLITLVGVAKAGSAFSDDKAWALYRRREKRRDHGAGGVADRRALSGANQMHRRLGHGRQHRQSVRLGRCGGAQVQVPRHAAVGQYRCGPARALDR